MPPQSTATMRPLDEVNYLLEYIDCACSHPRPLPEGTHTYRSSINGPTWMLDVYHCLYKLYRECMASESFREPVNALHYNIFHYYKVVSHPMSIREVLDRLGSGTYYSSVDQAERDIELIWNNAELFNGPGSEITAKAHQCRSTLAQLRDEWEDDKVAPVEEVAHLVEKLSKKSNENLDKELEELFLEQFPELLLETGDLNCEKVCLRHMKILKALDEKYS